MMDRRTFLKTITAASLTGLGTEMAFSAMQRPASSKTSNGFKRPNVVVILSDDHRHDVMSCVANPYIRTPHLDRLANEGVLFENAFATSGVCSPSRAAILTGQYAFQAGAPRIVWTNNTFRTQATPFPAQLHDAGYYVMHIGKWHLGRGNLGMPGYDHWAGFEWLGEFFDTTLTIDGQRKQFTGFSDDILSEYAAEKIIQHAQNDQPFCLFLAIKSPHLDFQYPPRHEHAFDGIDIPKPESIDEDFAQTGKLPDLKNVIGLENFQSGLKLFKTWDNYIKSYYRSCLAIDDAVGNVLNALDKAQVADDTLVIYTSDQGYSLGEHGLTEKHYAYEEPLRVPMIVRYPRQIKAGRRVSEMVLNIDIAPTLLDYCGVAPVTPMAGKSLKPLLDGQKRPAWREDFLFETVSEGRAIPGQVMVRTARYKLITYPWIDDAPPELYDLKKDPHEMQNVVQLPAYQNVLRQMQKRLERLKQETGWRKVVSYPVERCWVLGPVPPHETEAIRCRLLAEPFFDPARNRYEQGGFFYAWQQKKAVPGNPGEFAVHHLAAEQSIGTLFFAFRIVRNIDYDPYVLVQPRPVVPMRGYVNGKCYHDSPGGQDPVSQLMADYNPPLLQRDNLFILEFAALPTLIISFRGPQDAVRID